MRNYPHDILMILLLFFISGYILLLTGCQITNMRTIKTDIPIKEIRIHSVNYQHENLWMIAKWYTGEGKNWYQLKEYNGQLQANGRLAIGDQIRIPTEVMIRFDSMTPEFVLEQVARIKSAKKIKKREKDLTVKQPSIAPTEEEVIGIDDFETEEEGGYETATQDQLIENLLTK